jgi:transposase InsO family protein
VGSRKVLPFKTTIKILGKNDEMIPVMALVDDGAMVAAMDSTYFRRIAHQLNNLKMSTKRLRMANGTIVRSITKWSGKISVNGIETEAEFEVFDSGGSWDFLFGKPLLNAFKAIHDYEKEVIEVRNTSQSTTISNECASAPLADTFSDVNITEDTNELFYDAEDFPCEDADSDDEWEDALSDTDNEELSARDKNGGLVQTPLREVHAKSFVCELKGTEPKFQQKFKVRIEEVPDEDTFRPVDERTEREIKRTKWVHNLWKKDEREKWRLWKGGAQRRWQRWKTRLNPTGPPGLRRRPVKTDAEIEAEKHQKQKEKRKRYIQRRKTRGNSVGGMDSPPSREVPLPQPPKHNSPTDKVPNTTDTIQIATTEQEYEANIGVEVFVTEEEGGNIYTRNDEPNGAFNPARVEAMMKQIKIGNDLTNEQRLQVENLLRSYADCFALSVSEVRQVDDAVHRLNIPEGTTFSKRVHQKPLTPPQKQYLNTKIDEMIAAGVIEQCNPSDVKCVSPTTLAQKAHEGGGLSLDELRHRVNDECIAAGLPPHFDLPPRPKNESGMESAASFKPPKWRICQNFGEVNKVTEIAPMPQGDIRVKQQNVSGHRWLSLFDFASGFYAVKVAEESRPYTAFYVEGRGYFWYCKMPFGLTGAPSTFAHMTATHLHDLLANGIMELFVDDGATAANEFEDMMSKLRQLFDRVRERKLSLSASKSEFFVTEGIFAGAKVGPNGVTSDPAKLTAIVDWKQPPTALNLASFLGITGHFRDLIKDYSKIEGPLRNLIKAVPLPSGYNKSTYRRIMENYKLADKWTDEHTKSFISLKAALAAEPVLKAPQWDGTPFIVTTDGCKEGFAGVLAQRTKTILPSGKVVEKLHPIAFASKRTSTSERNYKPYLLEFAALKFALDKFSDIIWGFPIEIETDCQALRDVLISEKHNVTHARWRDGILAHQIVDVRHVPGKINVVADGFSRMWEDLPRQIGDGSEWTVSEDWESTRGITHDIFGVSHETSDYKELKRRFADEPVFLEVVEAIEGSQKSGSLRSKQRARHRALGYQIDNGRLWKVGGNGGARARSRVECVNQAEAIELARQAHVKWGHWGRDLIKLRLLDTFCSPKLDQSVLSAIKDCARCKNFGGTHLHALLEPITRRKPFELLVGDYLSLPDGKGGFKGVGLYLDVFSRHVWAFKYKKPPTGKTTTDALQNILYHFTTPEVFMTDGGKHFDNEEVRTFCQEHGIKPHVVAAYSPWINGLVEGTNKLLLHVLKRLCAPELGEDDDKEVKAEDIPRQWPEHLDDAIRDLNVRILPSLEFSPRELILGYVINSPQGTINSILSEPETADYLTHMAYVEQQRLDAYDNTLRHTNQRKEVFDKRVTSRKPGEVIFKLGQLVQVYRSDLDYTFKTERKILPKWSRPYRVSKRILNSYRLESLDGRKIDGEFSARRLRRFHPRAGTRLAEEQEKIEEQLRKEEESDEDAARFKAGAHGTGSAGGTRLD